MVGRDTQGGDGDTGAGALPPRHDGTAIPASSEAVIAQVRAVLMAQAAGPPRGSRATRPGPNRTGQYESTGRPEGDAPFRAAYTGLQ
ncbi:MAG: hypothetical protein AVDCRST_MAG88-1383 [uncultured Thermomicrobiales bacterium]|uniref:Uncharacterized protein n=1 Tax=uncultured Thermomicrobiales bacterium TaxID=1645740 RepID=A0A6J4UTR8_9BACT|nr:MAG: hypothetical protein AVDCRST_MAG88-1383 [uncultured Thermomicrobiales bacterium]